MVKIIKKTPSNTLYRRDGSNRLRSFFLASPAAPLLPYRPIELGTKAFHAASDLVQVLHPQYILHLKYWHHLIGFLALIGHKDVSIYIQAMESV